MTIVAMWCRHNGDDIIGANGGIPWNVPSDSQHFYDVVAGQTVVMGRKTYESLPGQTIAGCPIWVLTANRAYELTDAVMHRIVTGQREIADLLDEDGRDLYIAGGAAVYALFMTGKEKLKPQIVVDCVYYGELTEYGGAAAKITDSVAVLQKSYRRITPFYEADKVRSAVWIRKGEFVGQSVLKRIVKILERDTAVCVE